MTYDNSFQLEIINKYGMHMRPAAHLAKNLGDYDYAIRSGDTVIKNPGVMSLMTLGLMTGDRFEIQHNYTGAEMAEFYGFFIASEIEGEGRIFANPSDLEDAVVNFREESLPELTTQ